MSTKPAPATFDAELYIALHDQMNTPLCLVVESDRSWLLTLYGEPRITWETRRGIYEQNRQLFAAAESPSAEVGKVLYDTLHQQRRVMCAVSETAAPSSLPQIVLDALKSLDGRSAGDA